LYSFRFEPTAARTNYVDIALAANTLTIKPSTQNDME
jgi:hypothetical protein